MDGVGTFSNKMQYVGGLWGTDIHSAAPIKVADSVAGGQNSVFTYLGNRVNLYIYDNISSASRLSMAGLSIGLVITWSFDLKAPGVVPPSKGCIVREVDWNGETALSAMIMKPEKQEWIEQKVEYAASAPGSGCQLGEMDVNLYTLPINITGFGTGLFISLQRYRVLPITARGDSMKAYFWCNPNTWVGGVNDSIQLWVESGSDVAGSQRIGGGHG
jgi:hypothetical protein